MSQTRPAWYPDPSGRFAQRYHDGGRWTEHVLDANGANHRDAPVGPPAGAAGAHQQPVVHQPQPQAESPRAAEHAADRFAPAAAHANGASRAAPSGPRPPGPDDRVAPAARPQLPGAPAAPPIQNAPPASTYGNAPGVGGGAAPAAPSSSNAPGAPTFGQDPAAPGIGGGVAPGPSAPSAPSVPSAPVFGQTPHAGVGPTDSAASGYSGPAGGAFARQDDAAAPAGPGFAQQYPGPGNVANGLPVGTPADASARSAPGTGILPGGIALTVGVITAGVAALFAMLSLFVLGFQRFSAGGAGDSFSLSDASGPGAPFVVDIYGSLGRLLALAVISAAVLATLKLPQLRQLNEIPNLNTIVAGACGFMLVWHGAAMFSSPDFGDGGDLGIDLGFSVSPAFGAWLGLLAWLGLIAAQFLHKPVGPRS